MLGSHQLGSMCGEGRAPSQNQRSEQTGVERHPQGGAEELTLVLLVEVHLMGFMDHMRETKELSGRTWSF